MLKPTRASDKRPACKPFTLAKLEPLPPVCHSFIVFPCVLRCIFSILMESLTQKQQRRPPRWQPNLTYPRKQCRAAELSEAGVACSVLPFCFIRIGRYLTVLNKNACLTKWHVRHINDKVDVSTGFGLYLLVGKRITISRTMHRIFRVANLMNENWGFFHSACVCTVCVCSCTVIPVVLARHGTTFDFGRVSWREKWHFRHRKAQPTARKSARRA